MDSIIEEYDLKLLEGGGGELTGRLVEVGIRKVVKGQSDTFKTRLHYVTQPYVISENRSKRVWRSLLIVG